MCRIRSLFHPCEWHHGSAQYIRSHKRLAAEKARVKGFVCHPYSACTFYWECLHMTLTFAVFLYIPFQVFIICPNPYDPFILFCDFMSFINILASFGTGYVEKENKFIVLEPKSIARHYVGSTFLADLIGFLPLQVIHLYDNCDYPSQTIWLILKLFRLPTLTKESGNLLEQLELSYVKKLIIVLIVKVLIFFHWMTFIHYQVPCFTIHSFGEDSRYKVWLKRYDVVEIDHDSIFQKYTANLFLVCGLCIGAGYYSPVDEHLISELLLTSGMGLAGLIFLVYAFSILFQLALCQQFETNFFNGRYAELMEYMKFKRLPKFLQRKVQLYINYKFNGHYFNEEEIMSTINEQIRQDINMYGCKQMVMTVPLFQDMPIALINAIIFSLTQVLFMPGQVLVKYGQPGESLYMISSGTVAVMSSSGREVAHLRDGSYFGEIQLMNPGTERTNTIVALEITEIYKLGSKEFQLCLQLYPHLKRRLDESFLRRRLTSVSQRPSYRFSR